jgi:hypothetical protein
MCGEEKQIMRPYDFITSKVLKFRGWPQVRAFISYCPGCGAIRHTHNINGELSFSESGYGFSVAGGERDCASTGWDGKWFEAVREVEASEPGAVTFQGYGYSVTLIVKPL